MIKGNALRVYLVLSGATGLFNALMFTLQQVLRPGRWHERAAVRARRHSDGACNPRLRGPDRCRGRHGEPSVVATAIIRC